MDEPNREPAELKSPQAIARYDLAYKMLQKLERANGW